jgi:hypothetical protein
MSHLDQDAVWSAAAAPAGDPERSAAERHAAECSRCAAALSEARELLGELSALPPAPAPAPALAAVHEEVLRSQRGSRIAWGAAGACLALSLLAGFVDGSEPGLAPAVGAHCWLVEQLFAGLLFGGSWLLVRRMPALDAPRFAAAAAAGALLGQLYLHFRCPVAHALPHLLTFHVAGVLTALLGAALLGRFLLARTFAPR